MKAPWLDEVPESWEVRRFAWLGKWTGGGTPSKSDPTYWDGEIPWVSPKDMKTRVIRETVDHVTEIGVRQSSTRVVPAKSVLIVTRSGILRHSLPVAVTGRPMAINQDLKALIPVADVDARFVTYWIEANQDALLALWRKEGTTVESLETGLIRETPLPLPPHSLQQAIATFLDRETARIDTLIEKKRRLLDLLEEKRTALITRAVTRGLDPDVPMKYSGVEWIGEIPKHWEVAKIKHVARLESGHTPDRQIADYWDGGVGWVSLADSKRLKTQDVITETQSEISAQGLANSSARLLPKSAVVFSRDATVGLCALLGREMAVSQHFIAWVCSDRIRPRYLLLVLKSMTQELERLTMGATIRTLGLPEVGTLRTPIPPGKEQDAIVDYCDREAGRIYGLSNKAREALALLQEYRTALISAAVTGKIDVTERALAPA